MKLPILGETSDIAADGLGGLEHNFITGNVESLVNWARRRSTWPAT